MKDSHHFRNISLQPLKDAQDPDTPIDGMDKDLLAGFGSEAGEITEQQEGDEEEEEVCISAQQHTGCWLTWN